MLVRIALMGLTWRRPWLAYAKSLWTAGKLWNVGSAPVLRKQAPITDAGMPARLPGFHFVIFHEHTLNE
jgi:hypothetical protein